MDRYDLKGQAERRQKIFAATLRHFGTILSEDAALKDWHADSGLRDALFFTPALLGTSEPNTAFVEKLLDGYPKNEWERYCAFNPFMALVQLLQYDKVLTPRIRERLTLRAGNAFEENLHQYMDFVGVNDNHPAMGMGLLFLGAEAFNQPELTAVAEGRLRQLEQMIADRTFISEFNSPTYHAVTLYAIASIVNHIKDESIRARALHCEHALWEMLFMLYHRGSFQTAGPYCRAYMVDSRGHTHQTRMVLYQVMGEALAVNALNTLYREDASGIAIHGNAPWFMMVSNCWLAGIDYHCPRAYIDEALNRTYPAWVTGTAQVSASADFHLLPGYGTPGVDENDVAPLYKLEDLAEYAAGVTELFSYLTDDYAVGTCTKPFHNGGQTDSFHAIINDANPIARQEDLSTIYSRLIVNNQQNETHLISEGGRALCFQWKSTAMVLYSPKTIDQMVTSLKLAILIENHFGSVKEIRCGGKTLKAGDEMDAGAPIFVRFKKCYAMFLPLLADTKAKLRVENIQFSLSLSLIHYEGEARYMTRKALKLVPLGFVCEIRSEKEIGSFDAFIAAMVGAKATDALYANLHTRYTFDRQTTYHCGDTSLECSYSPVSEGIRFIRANGKLLTAGRALE